MNQVRLRGNALAYLPTKTHSFIQQYSQSMIGVTTSEHTFVTITNPPFTETSTSLETQAITREFFYNHLVTNNETQTLQVQRIFGSSANVGNGAFNEGVNVSHISSSFTSFSQNGELTYRTTSFYRLNATKDKIIESTVSNTSSISPSTDAYNSSTILITNTSEQRTLTSTIAENTSYTYPIPYIGVFYYSTTTIVDQITETTFLTTEGTTSTLTWDVYEKKTSTTYTSFITYDSIYGVSGTRELGISTIADLGTVYSAVSSLSEAIIVLAPETLDFNVTEGVLTDIARYTTTDKTTLLYQAYLQTNLFSPTKGLTTSETLGTQITFKSPAAFVTHINSSQTLYTERNTSFSGTDTYTLFTNTESLPFSTDTATYFTATTAGNTAHTTNYPQYVAYVGINPTIIDKSISQTTKTALVPGLGAFPFSIQVTASDGRITEYLGVKTATFSPGNVVSTSSSFYTFYAASATLDNAYFPDVVHNTERPVTFPASQTLFSTINYILTVSSSIQFANNPARSIILRTPQIIATSGVNRRNITLFSHFIVPGIRVLNGTDLYQNIEIDGEIFDLNYFSEFNTSFSEIFVLATFTNLRTFWDENFNKNYMKWENSNKILVTILDTDTTYTYSYPVSYSDKITKSSFVTARTLTNNISPFFDTIYEFGGPNVYSQSEVILSPWKGKYNVTRYNIAENTSQSVISTLTQYEVLTCGTHEYVKFRVDPYVTLDTEQAQLLYYLDSTVAVAKDVEE